ncbi:hypothetical protein ACI6Q2_19245 [Chitinophagaceae bacterium LWZ2-11]
MNKFLVLAGTLLTVAIASTEIHAQTTTTPPPPNSREERAKERRERVNQLIKQEEEGALIFQKQSAFGLKFNTDGFSLFYEHGKYKTITTTNLWWIEAGERKDHKQEHQSNLIQAGAGIYVTGNSYVFGKKDNFYFMRLGFGQQKLIGGKGNKNGVAVSAIYGGGLTAAFMKPYYVQIDKGGNVTQDIKYDGTNANDFLGPNIIGGSGFTKGWGEVSVVPGVTARTALRFDYGRYNEVLSALEVGLNAEYYTQKCQIMVNGANKNFFLNAYIAIVFGKRK